MFHSFVLSLSSNFGYVTPGKMSFGFGIGDFLVVLKLAKELKDRFAQAQKEYKGIYQE
jgi:hypothetical protein